MKQIIRLTESDLHKIIKESVKNVIMEYEMTPYDNLMQRSINNGGQDKVWEEYLSKKDTYYGAIAKIAMQNNHSYTDIIRDLQNKITEYNRQGRFGYNGQVLDIIGRFCSLLAYLNGAYEAAISRMRNGGVSESLLREWNPFAGMTYKDTNRYGVRQKIGDDKRGQWMKDLQSELKQMLEWKYLHGPKTVEATKAFIEFLEVEKRGLMDFVPLKKMAIALAGVAMLGGILNGQEPNDQTNSNMLSQNPPIQQVQQVQQQAQKIHFQVNSTELSQDAIQMLQQMGQNGGTFQIIVHESQNTSGMDSPHENELAQMRADTIKQALGSNVKVSFTRGTNSTTPYAEVIPGF
jgi:hypothetical protein